MTASYFSCGCHFSTRSQTTCAVSKALAQASLAHEVVFLWLEIEQGDFHVRAAIARGMPGRPARCRHRLSAAPRSKCGRTASIQQMVRDHRLRFAHGGKVIYLIPFHDQRDVIQQLLLLRRIKCHASADKPVSKSSLKLMLFSSSCHCGASMHQEQRNRRRGHAGYAARCPGFPAYVG